MKLKDDNEFVEITAEEEIAANIARIRPALLDEAQYPTRQIEQAWARLDDTQRAALVAWWK
jgi:hypothetical protein